CSARCPSILRCGSRATRGHQSCLRSRKRSRRRRSWQLHRRSRPSAARPAASSSRCRSSADGARPLVAAAAFFDLDRTLLRRSSAPALAGSFRARGLISRRQLLTAPAWQLLFAARGASHEAVRSAAEDGLRVLDAYPVEELRALVAEAMEPVLRPLVY